MTTQGEHSELDAFGRSLAAARTEAGLSTRKLARMSGIEHKRMVALEAGAASPTDRELGLLAQGCGTTVFALLPPGYGFEVLATDGTANASSLEPAAGEHALDALLREYLSMVVEMRAGRAVTAPSLRHDDLVELAAALGDTPEAIEERLVSLLGAGADDAPAIRSLILPSTAA